MFIKRVVLKNIRSYKEAEFDFPAGIVLLSGDIGSGKSSILLAVEFALFGLQRGDLTGGALLRNGACEGSVQLTFELDKNEYSVVRRVKRTSNGVVQDAGFIEIDGVRTDLTATELKSRILDLLGYPEKLLNRKALVYRFTVYTPQESMKVILEQDKEERLRILRTVFDVDKYQRIKENAGVYSKVLRERTRLIEGQLLDLEEKRKLKEEEERNLDDVDKHILLLEKSLKQVQFRLNVHRSELKSCEEAKKEFDALQGNIHINKARLDLEQRNLVKFNEDLKELVQSIASLEKDLVPVEDVAQKLKDIEEKVKEEESVLSSLRSLHAEHGLKRRQAQETAKKISELDHCPLCLQNVSSDHKSRIISEQKSLLRDVYEKEVDIGKKILSVEQGIGLLKQDLQHLRHKEKEFEVLKVRHAHLNSLKAKKVKIDADLRRTELDIRRIQLDNQQQKDALAPLKPVVEKYEGLRLKTESVLREEKSIEVQLAASRQKKSSCEKQINLLDDEIRRKEQAKSRLERIKYTNAWLSDGFVPLMDEMERHVMVRIHGDFDDVFKEWFSMLVEDGLMTARLDDSFSPIIQQNGYETETAFLSGGERTACALAYRLALNRTVNGLLNTIRTKDLLILDEPTDGFSSDQLDKMRDVLDQLKLRQIIIVSHEQKIESFADHTIRIEKQDHTSRPVVI